MSGRAKMSALALAAVVAVGCGGEIHPGWEESLAPEGPAMMEEAMVYLDRSFDELLLVRPEIENETPTLQVERVETGEEPSQMAVSADGRQLYVLNERGPKSLSIFDIGAGETVRTDVVLESSYDVINVDPYGEFVILSNSGQRRDDAIIQNLNEVGIIDLRGAEPEARFLSLATRAQNLEFMPPFELGGQDQRLVAALADSQITLVDLNAEAEQDQQRRVPLTISQADEVRRPVQVEFDVRSSEEGPDRVSLYVLNERDQDITEISVQSSIREDQQTKFDISVNQLAAGQRPGRIAMLDLERGRRLLALDGAQPRFTLVDVVSGESATYNLRMPVPAEEMIVYSTAVAGQDRLETRVLVYSSRSNLLAVIRPESIALGTETPTTGQAVEDIRLTTAAPARIEMDPESDGNRAIVIHSGGNDGFTVLNLNRNTEIPLPGFPLAEVVFDGSRAYGIFQNSPHMVRVNLVDVQAAVIPLPARARALHLSPDRDALMVRHDGSAGRFTVFPVAAPTAENGRLFEHVFLRDVLSRPAFED